jgi:hypothetical protein
MFCKCRCRVNVQPGILHVCLPRVCMASMRAFSLCAMRSAGASREIQRKNRPQWAQVALQAWGPVPGLSSGRSTTPQRGQATGSGVRVVPSASAGAFGGCFRGLCGGIFIESSCEAVLGTRYQLGSPSAHPTRGVIFLWPRRHQKKEPRSAHTFPVFSGECVCSRLSGQA